MKAEYTGVKIKIGDEEKTITVEQARELQAALNELLKPVLAQSDMLRAFREAAERAAKNKPPITVPMPYPVYPPRDDRPWYPPYPHRPNIIWCGGGQVRVEMMTRNSPS